MANAKTNPQVPQSQPQGNQKPDEHENELKQLHIKILNKLTEIGEIKPAEIMLEKTREDLEKTFLLLFDQEPYYGYFMGSFNRRYTMDPEVCPTLGVSVSGGSIQLIVNVIFWQALNLLGKGLILKHEALHIINEHIVRSKIKGIDGYEHQMANVSMDIAINQFIFKGWLQDMNNIFRWEEIAKEINFQFAEKYELPLDKPWEWYYDELMKRAQKNGKEGQMIMITGMANGIDSHKWTDGKGKPVNGDFIKEMIKSKIRDAAKSCRGRGRGTIPAEIEQMLEKWEHESKLDWKGLLRDFVTSAFASEYEQSFRRESRLHPDMFPGRKLGFLPEFSVGIDTSGSMSDELLGVVMKEIERIADDFDCEINVWQFDATTYPKQKYRRGDYRKFKLTGRGGTDFQPFIDTCVKTRTREVLIFTDGYAPTPEFKGVKVMWIFPENHQDHPGRKVLIPETVNK